MTQSSATSRTLSPPRHRALVSGALVATAILVLAACGSSSSKSVSTKPTTSVSAAAPTGAAAAVKTASNDKFGQILVDSKGKTLYTLTNAGKAVPCTGPCLAAWPPAMAAAGDSTDMSGVTTVSANGGKQLAYQGLPLYTYVGDSGPGTANGDGLNTFGGVWHVVMPTGAKTSTGDSSTTNSTGASNTTATTSGGRYGY